MTFNVQEALRGYINRRNGLAGLNDNGKIDLTQIDRDVAGGVAGLDANGDLIVPSSHMFMTRNIAGDLFFDERGALEVIQKWHRLGANNYTAYIQEAGVQQRVQTESMKNAPDGIAELDADIDVVTAADVADYGGAFLTYTPPTGSEGAIRIAIDTNATTPGKRIYVFANAAWSYVDLT